MRCRSIAGLLVAACLGCSSRGLFPASMQTQVDLSRGNYRVVRSNISGTSMGFSLLGIIPIVPPTYTAAMSDLQSQAALTEGQAQAFVNVVQEQTSLYLILFSLPMLTVRADIVEFTKE